MSAASTYAAKHIRTCFLPLFLIQDLLLKNYTILIPPFFVAAYCLVRKYILLDQIDQPHDFIKSAFKTVTTYLVGVARQTD